jgi:O-antigen/teichoic acid export membrane protein
LYAAKKTKVIPFITGIAAAINVGLNLLFIPYYGIQAAAWTTFTGYAVYLIMVYSASQHYYPLSIEKRRLTVLFILTLFAMGLGVLISKLTFGAALAATIILLLSFPFIVLLSGFLNPEDIVKIKGLLKKLSSRMKLLGRSGNGL